MATTLAAGDLRDRVTVQSKSTTSDGQGGRSVSWEDLATLWARIRPMTVNEKLQMPGIGSTQGWEVFVRYRADITPAMRLTWRPYQFDAEKTFEIHGVQAHGGGREFLRIDCAEVI